MIKDYSAAKGGECQKGMGYRTSKNFSKKTKDASVGHPNDLTCLARDYSFDFVGLNLLFGEKWNDK